MGLPSLRRPSSSSHPLRGGCLTTVAELLKRPETHETIVHFVNFDRSKPVAPFQASVVKQYTGPVKSVECFSPDKDDAETLKFEESGDKVTFQVPETRVYSMIVVRQGP